MIPSSLLYRPPEHIADEVSLDLHLNHLQRAPQNTTQDVGVPQLVLCSTIVWQFHKIGEWVLVEHERELVVVACPVRHLGRDIEEDLEPDLRS